MKLPALITLSLLVGSCASNVGQSGMTQIDQVPMYGGMDRSSDPSLREADEQLIRSVSAAAGSREAGAASYVRTAFGYYRRDDLANAMRRFNQAWLLDPKNPEVYWGFSSILHDQGKACPAMAMVERALALNPPTNQGFLPDAGRIAVLCAVTDATVAPDRKQSLLRQSEALYVQAEALEPKKGYVYASWASAYYWRGQYQEAWAMVAKARANGEPPNERFLAVLRGKAPEPK